LADYKPLAQPKLELYLGLADVAAQYSRWDKFRGHQHIIQPCIYKQAML
jgi:hypothetical protein